jgi:hypothetical protein
MVRTAGDCYQDETLCDGTVTAWLRGAVRGYWRVDPPGSDAGDVTLVEKDVVAGVGVAVPGPVEVAGVGAGVWLGVWVTPGVGEREGVGDCVWWRGAVVEAGVDGVWLCAGVAG